MSLTVQVRPKAPQITKADISRGYFYRFFAAKANQIKDLIYEIDRVEYERLRSNSYIVLVRIKWKITGNLEDVFVPINTGSVLGGGGLEEIRVPGVLTENESSVIFGSERIPALKTYITNFKEYYNDDSDGGTT